jgi:polyhydroxybutyrate depolymerase
MRRLAGLFLLLAACAPAAAPPQGEPLADGGVALDGAPAPVVILDGASASADVGLIVPADAGSAPVDGLPVAGCGTPGAPTGVLRKTLMVDGKARSYLLSVPASYRPGSALPLVFAWHGLGGSAMFFRAAHGLEAPVQGGALFVYPDALPLPSFGNATGWDLRPEGPDLRFFDLMTAEVTAGYCVDKARVFSTGHSFGGYMTNTLGCLRGEVLRGIAPVAGGLPRLTCGAKALPAWLTHGDNDGVVALSEGEGARDHWRARAGCGAGTMAVDPAGCVSFQGCSVPVHWCVHQRMHSWPPFASSAIWKFFASL